MKSLTKLRDRDEDEGDGRRRSRGLERQGRRRKRRGRLLGHSGGICEFGKEKRLWFTATVACFIIVNFSFLIFGLRKNFLQTRENVTFLTFFTSQPIFLRV
ncbi:hypothetical protein NC652_001791 [Populus alba x Populus x berolinensis]|nr:hypothetical protein NC652_001791 [Populus alba x Populus x berolinensis]